jgi:ribonuclease III
MRNNDSYLSQEERDPLFALSRRVHPLAGAQNFANEQELSQYVTNSPSYQETLFKLGLKLKDLNSELATRAFIHTSFHHEFSAKIENLHHNEQLEFIGDSVISLIITTLISSKYPSLKEGELSKLRSALVNKDALGQLGEFLQMERSILVGRGEMICWRQKPDSMPRSLLTNTFEALTAVLYLELGFKNTLKKVARVIEDYSQSCGTPFLSKDRLQDFDPKSRLQEITMALYQQLPTYQDHWTGNKFIVSLSIGERMIGEVSSISKRLAKQQLSIMALEQLKGEGFLSC